MDKKKNVEIYKFRQYETIENRLEEIQNLKMDLTKNDFSYKQKISRNSYIVDDEDTRNIFPLAPPQLLSLAEIGAIGALSALKVQI